MISNDSELHGSVPQQNGSVYTHSEQRTLQHGSPSRKGSKYCVVLNRILKPFSARQRILNTSRFKSVQPLTEVLHRTIITPSISVEHLL